MLTDFFPEFDEIYADDLYFQQDGAPPHTFRLNIDLLRGNFGKLLISRNDPIAWLPRSCDLTPLDYFLRRRSKAKAYSNPTTLEALEYSSSQYSSSHS